MPKLAVVQESSVSPNREKTLERAIHAVERSVAGGASLVVFPGTFIAA